MRHRLATLALAFAIAACATDNGGGVFGQTFGAPPSRGDGGDVPGDDGGSGDDGGATDGGDASPGTDAEAGPPACSGTGTVAVLAGDDAALSGSISVNGAAWAGGAIGGGAAKSIPALVAFGAGFVGATRGPSDALQAIPATTTFAAPVAIGAATTNASPALAVVGTSAHVVYSSAAAASVSKFFHGTNAGSGWDAATDPVQPPAGTQSFGPSAAAIAAAGTDLVFAQDGDDNGLYVQSLAGATWGAAAGVVGAGTYKPAPPALVSVSGTYDVVVAYVDKDTRRISAAGRNAGTKAWAAPAPIDSLATTDEGVSIARVGTAKLVIVYRGQNGKAYASIGTIGAAGLSWTAGAPLGPSAVDVDSAPSVATGVCGDDAIAVYASAGLVRATRLHGTTWSSPEPVTGASGARVAVATR